MPDTPGPDALFKRLLKPEAVVVTHVLVECLRGFFMAKIDSLSDNLIHASGTFPKKTEVLKWLISEGVECSNLSAVKDECGMSMLCSCCSVY